LLAASQLTHSLALTHRSRRASLCNQLISSQNPSELAVFENFKLWEQLQH